MINKCFLVLDNMRVFLWFVDVCLDQSIAFTFIPTVKYTIKMWNWQEKNIQKIIFFCYSKNTFVCSLFLLLVDQIWLVENTSTTEKCIFLWMQENHSRAFFLLHISRHHTSHSHNLAHLEIESHCSPQAVTIISLISWWNHLNLLKPPWPASPILICRYTLGLDSLLVSWKWKIFVTSLKSLRLRKLLD